MSRRTTTAATLAGALTLVLALPGLAQEPGAPAMTQEEKAMMEKWEKASTPGPQHAELAAMAGTWDVQSTWWMQPGQPPEKSTGTAERSMILGGRVMLEKFQGSMMGQSFEGLGATGFDNVVQQYWGTWMDSMGTGMMATTGTCDAGKCEFTGSYNDPMTGGKQTMRMVSEHGKDRETMVMYGPGPDGKEYKMGELVYTRKK